MSKRPSAWIALSLKLVITTILLCYLLSKVSLRPALSQIAAVRPLAALGAVMLVLVQLALGSLRWQLISGLLEAPMNLARAFRFTLIGQFFNQVLPTALGGDAVRALLASNDGAPLGNAIRAVLCDRVVGLVALLIVISVTLFVMPRFAEPSQSMRYVLRTTAILTFAGLAVLYFFGTALARQLQRRRWARAVGHLIRDLRAASYSRATSAWTLSASCASHVITVGAICLCANGIGIALDFGAAMTVVPAIVLVSMAPISIAGWGVREGAMVVGLGLLGVVAGDALAVSVAYGLVQVLVGFVGGALWLAGSRTRPARSE
jgi:uncharacterized protein (TIRG00374 family)